jgi:hypothetical protein
MDEYPHQRVKGWNVGANLCVLPYFGQIHRSAPTSVNTNLRLIKYRPCGTKESISNKIATTNNHRNEAYVNKKSRDDFITITINYYFCDKIHKLFLSCIYV